MVTMAAADEQQDPIGNTTTSNDSSYLIGVILGAVIGVLVVVLLLVYVFRRKLVFKGGDLGTTDKGQWVGRGQSGSNIPSQVQNEAFDDQTVFTNRVRVFVLYNSDNVHHENTVAQFSTFLHNMCSCDVRVDRWCQNEIRHKSKLDWLHEEITKADKIVIIHSEGACRRWLAMKEGKVFQKIERSSPSTDTFLQGLRLVTECLQNPVVDLSRFISVRFNYTRRDFEIPTVVMGISRYELMDHMEELFFHLHSMNREEPGSLQRAKGISDQDFSSYSSEGTDLSNSIASVHNYINDHPQWFGELYGEAASSETGTPQQARVAMTEPPVFGRSASEDLESVFSDDCATIHRDEISVQTNFRSTDHANRLTSVGSIEV